ncbi:MAG: hypothetical protein M9894_20865 [Planctomycetes bacterium]|nr:hypothetical protein [Planctomycetota bacterium]
MTDDPLATWIPQGPHRCTARQVVRQGDRTAWVLAWRWRPTVFDMDDWEYCPDDVVFETHDAGATWRELPALTYGQPDGRGLVLGLVVAFGAMAAVLLSAALVAFGAPARALVGALLAGASLEEAERAAGEVGLIDDASWLALPVLVATFVAVIWWGRRTGATVGPSLFRTLHLVGIDALRLDGDRLVAVAQASERRGPDSRHEVAWDGGAWRYLRAA